MGSTPPAAAASPDLRQWMLWAEKNISDGVRGNEVLGVRVGAAQKGASNAAATAGEANAIAKENAEQRDFPTPSGALIANLLDTTFWGAVVEGKKSVFGNTGTSSATNVAATPLGLELTGTADVDAWIDVTAVRILPATRKLFLSIDGDAGVVAVVTWYANTVSEAGEVHLVAVGQTNPAAGTVTAPANAEKYSVALTVVAGGGTKLVRDISIFEVFGGSGLTISPGGVRVEDGSGNATTEINPSLPLLTAPTPPILSSSAASVTIKWNGALVAGPAPAHLGYLYVESASSAAGPWTPVGQPINLKTRDIVQRPPVGTTVWYRLVPVDTSGRPGEPSAAASVVVAKITLPELDGEIGTVLETVDGLNKIFYNVLASPPTAHANGDLWYVVDPGTTNVSSIRIWNGTAWVPYIFVASEVLAAESITAPLFKAGQIEVNHVSPTFGSDLMIDGNVIITAINQQVDQNQSSLSAQQTELDEQAAQITATKNAATNAGTSANQAKIAAQAAADAAAAAQEDVDRYGTVFAFESDGLSISSPGGAPENALSLKLTNADITIRRGGVAATTWNSEFMDVPKLKAEQVFIGQTVITEATGRTTWQRL